MAFKLLFLLFTGVASAATLRTNDSQQFLNARAPRNYVVNSGAEKNDLSVTDASAIHTRTTSTPLVGDGSHAIDATATAQTVVFLGTAFQPGVQGGACELRFNYSGDASLYRAYATLNGVAVSDKVNNQLVNVSSGSQTFSAVFPCGVSSSHVASVVIESTGNGAAIKVDGVYVGEATGIGSVAQAEFVGSVELTGTNYQNTAVSGLGNFGDLTAGTAGYSITNGTAILTAPGSNRAGFTATLPAGTYRISYVGPAASSTGSYCQLRFFDGTDQTRPVAASTGSAGASGSRNYEGTLTYSTVGTRTIRLQVAQPGIGECSVPNPASLSSGTIYVYRFPTASETVARLDAPGVELTSYTPGTTQGFGTTTSNDFQYQCGAGLLYITAVFTSWTVDGSEARIGLPSGFTVGATTSKRMQVGNITRGGSAGPVTAMAVQGRTYLTFGGGASSRGDVIGSSLVGSTETVNLTATVPVTASSPCAKSPQVLIPGSVYYNTTVLAGGTNGTNTIEEGLATLTRTNGTNVAASILSAASYMRIGKRVTVFFVLDSVNNTTGTGQVSSIALTLPVAKGSNFSNASEAYGSGGKYSGLTDTSVAGSVTVAAKVSSQTVEILWNSTGVAGFRISGSFTYLID